jgi:hypothetical protein
LLGKRAARGGFVLGGLGYPPDRTARQSSDEVVGFTSVVTETLNVQLAGGRDAAGRARAAVGALNGNLSAFRDTVQLLVTELVTNSFRHAGADSASLIEVRVLASPGTIRVEVQDEGPGFDAVPRSHRGEHGGFGLLLVNELADRWGVDEYAGFVWFELDRGERHAPLH